MKRGRPAKAICISYGEQSALCVNCPRPICRGTGDPYCPIRIASKEKRRKEKADDARRKRRHYQDRKVGRGYWPEIHGEV